MLKRLYELKTFSKYVLDKGMEAILYARRNGADFSLTMAFCGYLLESRRQGFMNERMMIHGRKTVIYPTVRDSWMTCVRQNHRYLTYNHVDEYRSVGRRILIKRMARKLGFTSDTPAEIVWDKME